MRGGRYVHRGGELGRQAQLGGHGFPVAAEQPRRPARLALAQRVPGAACVPRVRAPHLRFVHHTMLVVIETWRETGCPVNSQPLCFDSTHSAVILSRAAQNRLMITTGRKWK